MYLANQNLCHICYKHSFSLHGLSCNAGNRAKPGNLLFGKIGLGGLVLLHVYRTLGYSTFYKHLPHPPTRDKFESLV